MPYGGVPGESLHMGGPMPRKTPQKPVSKPRVARNERLETRLTDKQKELIAQAAEVLGVSTSQFIVSSAVRVAKRVLRDDDLIRMNDRDRETLIAALVHPAEPSATLRAAWKDLRSVAE